MTGILHCEGEAYEISRETDGRDCRKPKICVARKLIQTHTIFKYRYIYLVARVYLWIVDVYRIYEYSSTSDLPSQTTLSNANVGSQDVDETYNSAAKTLNYLI